METRPQSPPTPQPADQPDVAAHQAGLLRMVWADLLFLHWRVDPDLLRPHLPPEIELDLFEGEAYLAVVPFEMRGVRFRFLPPMPTAHRFPEINLRTYVRHRGQPGVWFFSLDASSRLSVRGARATFSLPYMDAEMRYAREPEDWISYESSRTHRGVVSGTFKGRYRPSGPVERSRPGSLESFLTERYSLFAKANFGVPRFPRGGPLNSALRGPLLRGDIHHEPWPLQPAEVELENCDMFRLVGLDGPPPGEPLAHFAREVSVTAKAPQAAK